MPPTTPDTPKPSPAVRLFEITDPTTAGEGLQVFEQEAMQLEGHPLRARRVMIRFGANVLLFTSTNLCVPECVPTGLGPTAD